MNVCDLGEKRLNCVRVLMDYYTASQCFMYLEKSLNVIENKAFKQYQLICRNFLVY